MTVAIINDADTLGVNVPPPPDRGQYGPVYPKTTACYGFSIIAKVKQGREDAVRADRKQLRGPSPTAPMYRLRCDCTICADNYSMSAQGCNFTTVFGGTDSLKNFWNNLATMG